MQDAYLRTRGGWTRTGECYKHSSCFGFQVQSYSPWSIFFLLFFSLLLWNDLHAPGPSCLFCFLLPVPFLQSDLVIAPLRWERILRYSRVVILSLGRYQSIALGAFSGTASTGNPSHGNIRLSICKKYRLQIRIFVLFRVVGFLDPARENQYGMPSGKENNRLKMTGGCRYFRWAFTSNHRCSRWPLLSAPNRFYPSRFVCNSASTSRPDCYCCTWNLKERTSLTASLTSIAAGTYPNLLNTFFAISDRSRETACKTYWDSWGSLLPGPGTTASR